MTSDDAMRLAEDMDCGLSVGQIGRVCAAILSSYREGYRKGVSDCRKIAAGEIESKSGKNIVESIDQLGRK